jgi:hypothetical protein
LVVGDGGRKERNGKQRGVRVPFMSMTPINYRLPYMVVVFIHGRNPEHSEFYVPLFAKHVQIQIILLCRAFSATLLDSPPRWRRHINSIEAQIFSVLRATNLIQFQALFNWSTLQCQYDEIFRNRLESKNVYYGAQTDQPCPGVLHYVITMTR